MAFDLKKHHKIVDIPYNPITVYRWSLGWTKGKDKSAIRKLIDQIDKALIKEWRSGKTPHINWFYLIEELKDRADDPSWRIPVEELKIYDFRQVEGDEESTGSGTSSDARLPKATTIFGV